MPIGVVAIAATARYVAESRRARAARPDWAGAAVFTAALAALVYGLIRAGQESWSDGVVIACLAGAAVLLGVFVAIERTVADPMFDLSLLRIPTFLGRSVAALTMNGSLFAMFLYVVLYLQNGLGYSAWETGLRLLLVSGTTLVAATVAGRLSTAGSARWLVGPGLLLVGAGMMLLTGLDAGSGWTHFIAGFLVAGFGAGLVNPPLASTAVGVVTPDRSGMASGINNTWRQVGIAVGTAVYGTMFTAGLRSSLAGSESFGGADGDRIADALQHGGAETIISGAPEAARPAMAHDLAAAFASSMNGLLLTGGLVAVAGGVLSLLLIRPRDFV